MDQRGGKYDQHWSFQPLPESVKVPKSNHPNPQNEIDHFIAPLANSALELSGG